VKEGKKQEVNYVLEEKPLLNPNSKYTLQHMLTDTPYKFVKEKSRDWMVKNNAQVPIVNSIEIIIFLK
jgi:hypothetical protein